MGRFLLALFGGCIIGALGGLIGLGGAEFRLPLLIGPFGFAALDAVILNKAMSLVVVATALPFRSQTIPWASVAEHWPAIVNLLAGSLAGAWFGAGWALKLKTAALYRILAGLLVMIGLVLLLAHSPEARAPLLDGMAQAVAGVVAGFGIGVVASLMGVAGSSSVFALSHNANLAPSSPKSSILRPPFAVGSVVRISLSISPAALWRFARQ